MKAKELNHNTYFTTEHGWGGNVWEAYTLCKENDLKMIFSAEVYYVDDRHEQDRGNYHLILVAKNFEGYKDINRIISEANKTGYYYKPRIDLELLLSVDSKNVIVTTACVGSRLFKSDNFEEEFLIPVHNYFKNNFYLEVQNHNDDYQKSWNEKILELSARYKIDIIHANDSHYIKQEDSKYRQLFLKAKGIVYEEETGFILDYPSYDEIIDRYIKQGVLSEEQAIKSLENTLVFDGCEDLGFNKEFKIPKVTEGDSNNLLKQILNDSWKKESVDIKEDRRQEYLTAIRDEMSTVAECNMADYFILDHLIVKKAVEEYDAVLTRSGRGSAVSFYINKLLGLTEVDRLKAPVTLYPSRFMTAERIIDSRSLPDIDLNFADVEPVIKASKDILGEDGIYYMIAFKPLQESSAFRLWCKANDMELSEYNDVAKNLDSFVNDKRWGKIIEDSKVFRGVIESVSPSPCSFLLLDKPISEEVGLIKVGNEMCCCLDGYQCDQWKFLKNDYLTVKVYKLISETYKEIGRPIDSISELVNNADDDVWKLYRDGITTTLNQADSDFATPIVKKYSPTTLAELSAWVSAIRPGFASLLNDFIERKGHSTGVDELDELLSDSYAYMLYQESIMKFLVWLDVPEKDTYDVIKKISKKKFKESELKELKNKLKNSWIKKIGTDKGFEENWQVVDDAVRYSFNASHALSVAIDSLYGAYLKSKHSLEYMTTALNLYDDDIERTVKLVKELEYFNIKLISPKFGYSKGRYFYDKKSNNIYKGIASLKNLNEKVGDELYFLSKENSYDNFLDLLIDIKEKTSCNSRQLDILVKLDYFDIFGGSKKLINFIKYFELLYNKKAPKKKTISEKVEDVNIISIISKNSIPTEATYTKFDHYICLKEILSNIRDEEVGFVEKIKFQSDILGSISFTNEKLDKRFVLITSIKDNGKYTPVVDTYCLNNGKTCKCKINKKIFKDNPLSTNEMIYINSMEKKFGYKIVGQKENGKPIFETDHNKIEWWITSYNIIEDKNEVLI